MKLRIFLILALFFISQAIFGAFALYQLSFRQNGTFLAGLVHRVNEDVRYQNGRWNTDQYYADPNLPGTAPLYILTVNGYVVDRWKPVHGFLDVSDFSRLLQYQSPQTVTTPTNQSWRMLSRAVESNGKIVGVITISYLNFHGQPLDNVDTKLVKNLDIISSHIHATSNTIDTSGLDFRQVDYDVAFQIVNQFNRILVKNNNTNSIDQIPNFIDTSYVADAMQEPSTRIIQDDTTGEQFLVLSSRLYDSHHTLTGVVVVGKSIQYLYSLSIQYLVLQGILGIIGVPFLTLFLYRLFDKRPMDLIEQQKEQKTIEHISFDQKASELLLDDVKIHIPYATNQYYLCDAIFSSPQKRWEVDELLERFGEDFEANHARSVYDTMIHVNKKVVPFLGEKLVVNKEKTYYLNPVLLDKVTRL